MQLPTKTLLALLPFILQAEAFASGTGTTTRYWDCCKPSCAWPGKAELASGSHPVTTCDIKDSPLTDYNTASGCNGGGAYQCSDESPWAINDSLAYGFAAVNIAGGSESSWCCACYELTFTSGPVSGKKMIVQATNTGGDLSGNQFDISMPGGGVGIFNGCTQEWGAPSSGWGAQYGGVASSSSCEEFPAALQAGCRWRFGWFGAADNPTVEFKQVKCPAEITAKSGCTRADDESAPKAAAGGSGGGGAVVAAASSKSVAPVATPKAVESSAPIATAEPVDSSTTQVKPSSAPVINTPATSTGIPATPLMTYARTSSATSVASTPTPVVDDEDDACEL
ncbi:RlpA-like double-psi beta-barrel-protein domain-containing protein-containing protein [Rhexocercosporidium sp. MPI-PUGE-AT-0058]|nr:RlpA-like double-psi beta-barrel-protein domain-containing protein-containing protein [Rhexocercosporidium sp. MPI-PUGE-AT-0058]